MSSYAIPNGNVNALPHTYNMWSVSVKDANDYKIQISQKCLFIGELEGISYAVTREMTPIYATEEIIKQHYENIRRGRQGIAGSVIFKDLNRDDVISNEFHIQILSDYNHMCIIGAELIDEGSGINLKDIELNKQYAFVAKDIIPWFHQK